MRCAVVRPPSAAGAAGAAGCVSCVCEKKGAGEDERKEDDNTVCLLSFFYPSPACTYLLLLVIRQGLFLLLLGLLGCSALAADSLELFFVEQFVLGEAEVEVEVVFFFFFFFLLSGRSNWHSKALVHLSRPFSFYIYLSLCLLTSSLSSEDTSTRVSGRRSMCRGEGSEGVRRSEG